MNARAFNGCVISDVCQQDAGVPFKELFLV